jgi:hypothetical protein
MKTTPRRLWAATAATAVLASITVGAWPSQAADTPPADPELGTLIAGEGSYVDGTHVWTDYAYDDRGPNDNNLPGGDAKYPETYPANTADLIQLQLGTAGDGALTVTALLETLVDDANAVIGVGLDTDADPSTGAPSIPGGKWENAHSIGLEKLIVMETNGTGVLKSWDAVRGQWGDQRVLTPHVEADVNTVSADLLDLRPGSATWNAVGLVGIEDATGNSWLNGGQPIFDLAYLRAENPTNEVAVALREQVPQLGFVPYQDKDQADVLSGAIAPHRAIAHIDFGTDRNTEPTTQQGFNAFLYHSRVPGLEGVKIDATGLPSEYDGPYMPYAVWIPPTVNLANPTPLLVFLHGANQYQNVNVVHFNNPQSLGVKSPYDVPAVVIFPNGRTTGWGSALAERDALDSIADALARPALHINPDRIVLTGVSSGGHGTYSLASRYPDLFTGAYSLVGATNDDNALESLTNVPFRASNGLADPW